MKPGFVRAAFLLFISVYSCNSNTSATAKKEDTTVQAAPEKKEESFTYDAAKPEKKWTLPNDLLEISGITWIDKNHLVAIEDLRPDLYLIRLDDSAIVEKKIPFHETSKEKFDVEDVTVVDHTAYAMYSHGKIFKIDNWNDKPEVKEIKTFL